MSEEIEKDIKHNQDQSSKMLLLELNFRHNAVVLRVTLKSIMLKFSSIMYLTQIMQYEYVLFYGNLMRTSYLGERLKHI